MTPETLNDWRESERGVEMKGCTRPNSTSVVLQFFREFAWRDFAEHERPADEREYEALIKHWLETAPKNVKPWRIISREEHTLHE